MPRQQKTPRLRASVRPPAEMTESQIETLMNFGRQEALLLDELEAATRAGDRDEAWRLLQEFCRIEDEAKQPPPAA